MDVNKENKKNSNEKLSREEVEVIKSSLLFMLQNHPQYIEKLEIFEKEIVKCFVSLNQKL